MTWSWLPWPHDTIFDWLAVIYTGVLVLIIVWAQRQVYRSPSPKKMFPFLLATAFVQWAAIAVTYILTAREYAVDPVKKFLLPPHSTILWRHASTDVTALVTGWIFALVLLVVLWRYCIIRRRGELLDGVDIALLVLGAAAVGWPAVFIFLVLVFAVTVIGMLILVLLRRRAITDRFVITPFILPAAILTLLFHAWLLRLTHLGRIGF